jgi:hypothetical protein
MKWSRKEMENCDIMSIGLILPYSGKNKIDV